MKLYLILLIAPLALAGHWSACVVPGGERRQVETTDCCSKSTPHYKGEDSWSYDSGYKDWRSSVAKDNSLDSGKFAKCCGDYNLGSVGG